MDRVEVMEGILRKVFDQAEEAFEPSDREEGEFWLHYEHSTVTLTTAEVQVLVDLTGGDFGPLLAESKKAVLRERLRLEAEAEKRATDDERVRTETERGLASYPTRQGWQDPAITTPTPAH